MKWNIAVFAKLLNAPRHYRLYLIMARHYGHLRVVAERRLAI